MDFNKNAVLEQSKKYNSFYLYDEKTILERAKRLKNAFDGIGLLYSIKTNPYINVGSITRDDSEIISTEEATEQPATEQQVTEQAVPEQPAAEQPEAEQPAAEAEPNPM